MNPTDPAAKFFADLLLPLHNANFRRGVTYLDRGPRRQSYWGDVASRTGGIATLPKTACDGLALLALLGQYWTQRGEDDLLLLLSDLSQLRHEVINPMNSNDNAVQPAIDFVYPLA